MNNKQHLLFFAMAIISLQYILYSFGAWPIILPSKVTSNIYYIVVCILLLSVVFSLLINIYINQASSMTTKFNKEDEVYIKWIKISVLLVFATFGGCYIYVTQPKWNYQWENFANASGIFTSLGVLFTGLSVVGLIATLLLQQKELRLQREELELQRKELRISNNSYERHTQEFIKINEHNNRQDYKSSMMYIIEQYTTAIDRVKIYNNQNVLLHGNDAFTVIVEQATLGNLVNIDSIAPGIETFMITSQGTFDAVARFGMPYFDLHVIFFQFIKALLTYDITYILIHLATFERPQNLLALLEERKIVTFYHAGISNINKTLKHIISMHKALGYEGDVKKMGDQRSSEEQKQDRRQRLDNLIKFIWVFPPSDLKDYISNKFKGNDNEILIELLLKNHPKIYHHMTRVAK